MTRGRLWVCWDHCQASWLTLPTYLPPHLETHIEVLWSTEQLFTLCMVVPSTVRSLCTFRALTSLVAHVNQSHLVLGAVFLILEDPISGEWPYQLQTLFKRRLFWSWEWCISQLQMAARALNVDSTLCQGQWWWPRGQMYPKILLFFCRFYPRIGVTCDESEAQIHSTSMPCSLSFLIPCSLTGSSKASCQTLFWRPFLAWSAAIVFLSKTLAIVP